MNQSSNYITNNNNNTNNNNAKKLYFANVGIDTVTLGMHGYKISLMI